DGLVAEVPPRLLDAEVVVDVAELDADDEEGRGGLAEPLVQALEDPCGGAADDWRHAKRASLDAHAADELDAERARVDRRVVRDEVRLSANRAAGHEAIGGAEQAVDEVVDVGVVEERVRPPEANYRRALLERLDDGSDE